MVTVLDGSGNNIQASILVALVVLQTACAESTSSVKNKEEAVIWFSDNENDIEKILAILFAHPNIQRVEDMRMQFIPKYGEFSEADEKAYKFLFSLSENMGIKAISVARKRNSIEGDLLGVDIILISEGLTTKGYALSIEYIPDSVYVEKAKGRGVLYQQLNKENWYLAEYLNN